MFGMKLSKIKVSSAFMETLDHQQANLKLTTALSLGSLVAVTVALAVLEPEDVEAIVQAVEEAVKS